MKLSEEDRKLRDEVALKILVELVGDYALLNSEMKNELFSHPEEIVESAFQVATLYMATRHKRSETL